jgi:hypothetical protein
MGTYNKYLNNVKISTEKVFATGSSVANQAWRRTWDQLNPGPPYRRGGPFKSILYHLQPGERKGFGRYTSQGNPDFLPGEFREYIGDFRPDSDWGAGNSSNFSTSDLTSFASLAAYHTQAWDRLKPTVQKAGLTQFLVELRELPTMLATSANLLHNSWRSFGGGYSKVVMHPSSVADNFLNHNFGWVPFINDLTNLHDLWINSHKYIQETQRMNGEWIRRRRVLETTETTVRTNRQYNSGTDPNLDSERLKHLGKLMTVDGVNCRAICDIEETNVSEIWAVGSFRYYRPEFDDSLQDYSSSWMTLQRLLTLYGARINPSVVWKLTPWSWAIDWFTSIGKHIDFHTDFIEDGITSKYLYIMKKTERRFTKSSFLNLYSGPLHLSWFKRLNLKQREVADSPYGFNRPWNTLSPKQLSILGAIGITRLNSGFISRGA